MRVRWVPAVATGPSTAEVDAGTDLAAVLIGQPDDFLFNRQALIDAIDSGNAEVWVIRDGQLDEVFPLTQEQSPT